MSLQQKQRDTEPLKEQLKKRLQTQFAFPESVTEGWEKEETLEAIAAVFDEWEKWSRPWIKVLPMLAVIVSFLLAAGMIRRINPEMSLQFLWFMIGCQVLGWTVGHFVSRWFLNRKKVVTPEIRQRNDLAVVLGALLNRVDESRLVPVALEAMRRVPAVTEKEKRESWERAEDDLLARLLPRMTESEILALTGDQVAYLRKVLGREPLSDSAAVAVLLTLASRKDDPSRELAQRYCLRAAPPVQLAAQELLSATRATTDHQ